MKPSFLLFAAADLTLLALTAVTGLLVSGGDGYTRHFLLGMLAALFTVFVHIVVFMYFVVQLKIIEQATLADGLDSAFALRAQSCKRRALRCCAVGLLTIVATSLLGAAIETGVPAEVHLVVAFSTVAINAVLFFYESALLDEYRGIFRAAFDE